jgi:hypothetical protein
MNGFERSKVLKRLASNHTMDNNGCYIWTKNISSQGYGTTHIFGKIYLVHRLSVLFFQDLELDTNIQVRHKSICKSRACFNPDHLSFKILQD